MFVETIDIAGETVTMNAWMNRKYRRWISGKNSRINSGYNSPQISWRDPIVGKRPK